MARKKIKNVKDTLHVHSKAKVEFYGTYLERYLRILNNVPYIQKINLYDVFCGTGIYDNGGKGSPIVAFDAIKKAFYEQGQVKKVSLTVNDYKQDKIDSVKAYIDANNKGCCDVSYLNLDAGEMFEYVKKQIKQSDKTCRNLIFIDPYGYKTIKKETINEMMGKGYTEIILFLPISHMHRFLGPALTDDKPQYKPLRDFVDSFFDEKHVIRQGKVSVLEYIKYVKDALNFENSYYTTSYFIERDDVNYFALFFLSSNILGFEKILEVKWGLDAETGSGFKQEEPQLDLFAEQVKEETKKNNFEALKEALLSYIAEPKNNHEVYLYTLMNGYLPTHANEVFQCLQNNNKAFRVVDIKKGANARRSSFYLSYQHYKNDPKVQFRLD